MLYQLSYLGTNIKAFGALLKAILLPSGQAESLVSTVLWAVI
jgi:hypothetical protein